MLKEPSFEKLLSTCELSVGIVLALLIGYLHYVYMHYAGGLWRDEIVSFNIATNPSFMDGFQLLKLDSFPGFFHLLMRVWYKMGFAESDIGIRLFGSLIGLSLLASFWLVGRSLGYRIPLFSSVLIGLSPLAIRTSDSIRAYGIGTTLIILTLGLIWVTVQKPSLKNIFFASLAAILSVQSLYQNSFLLLAICLGAFAVTIRHRAWKHTIAILSIGIVSALSLLLYLKTIQQMSVYKELVVLPTLTMERITQVFSQALSDGGKFMLWVWLALVVTGIVIALYKQFSSNQTEQHTTTQDLQLFSVITLISAAISFIIFLKIINFPTQTWYYIPVMALVAVLLDTIFATFFQVSAWRTSRVVAMSVLAIILFFQAIPGVQIRQTNIDIIADKLAHDANKNDFILVLPWHNGTTFARYFHGNTAWSTLPPLNDFSLQRLDLFKEQMQLPNPITPVLTQIAETLKSGNNVWIVGNMQSLPEDQIPPELPPAPNSQWGWNHDAYSAIWEWQAAHFIRKNAGYATDPINMPLNQAVFPFESSTLYMVGGWRN